VINTLLLIAAGLLLLTIVRIRAYDMGRMTGRREGFSHALEMFTQATEAQSEREVEEQREFIRQLGEEGATRRRAAEVARWN
jgi:hypothetical protein